MEIVLYKCDLCSLINSDKNEFDGFDLGYLDPDNKDFQLVLKIATIEKANGFTGGYIHICKGCIKVIVSKYKKYIDLKKYYREEGL